MSTEHHATVFRADEQPHPSYRGPAQPWRLRCTCFRHPDQVLRCRDWKQAMRMAEAHLLSASEYRI